MLKSEFYLYTLSEEFDLIDNCRSVLKYLRYGRKHIKHVNMYTESLNAVPWQQQYFCALSALRTGLQES